MIRPETLEGVRRAPPALHWGAIVAAFAVAHAPADRLEALLRGALERLPAQTLERLRGPYDRDLVEVAMAHFVVPLKGFVFLLALVVLAVPIVHSVRAARSRYAELPWRRLAGRATAILLGLCALWIPFRPPYGLEGSFGLPFAEMSLDPFAQEAGLHHRRLLPVALAHYLGLEGIALYGLFALTSVWGLVFWLCAYLDRYPGRARLGAVHVLSIATSSFVMSQLQAFGLSENLAFSLAVFLLMFPLGVQAQMSVVALALLTHEASVFMLGPLLLFARARWADRVRLLSLPLLFVALWMLSYAGDLAALSGPSNVARARFLWLTYPGSGLAGVAVSFKLLWLLVPVACALLVRAGRRTEAAAILAVVLSVLAMELTVVDTSRLGGYAFPALLASVVVAARHAASPGASRALRVLLLANLAIPSFWVTVGSTVSGTVEGWLRLRPGLYLVEMQLLRWLFS